MRLTSLAARKNQVEFEGQQINQQRVVLSQKSSAVYNQMLEMQVPTAPDPSNYTKIVYKFNAGYGESQILNMAKKASGPYNYSIKYKSPATEKVLSRSTYNNVSFDKPTDKIGNDKFQYLNSNIKTDHTITNIEEKLAFDGSILKRASIPLSSIKNEVTFNIHIVTNSSEEYMYPVHLQIPLQNEDNGKNIYDGSYSQEVEFNNCYFY